MTAKVVPFPRKSKQNLTDMERLIRKWLLRMSADNDLIECVADRMMAFIDKYASKSFEPTFNLLVPPNLSEEEAKNLLVSIEMGVDNTAKQVYAIINQIIVERLFLEIEIYESQKSEKR